MQKIEDMLNSTTVWKDTLGWRGISLEAHQAAVVFPFLCVMRLMHPLLIYLRALPLLSHSHSHSLSRCLLSV